MSTTLAENKELAVRWLDLVSDGDLEGLYRIIAPTWRLYGGPPGKVLIGHEGLRELFEVHMGPIEQKWTIDDVIAEGDRVVVRATNTCMQDEFAGVPARGKRQVFTATFTFRIADGLIVEQWRNADDLGRLLQLGARIVAGDETAMST
jgi:predicted SnoaL-like aldol condensation-catalyzing enzyme